MKLLLIIFAGAWALAAHSQPIDLPPNFASVSKDLFRGARVANQETANYLTATYGIRTIINLQGGDYNDSASINKFGAALYHKLVVVSDPGESREEIAAEGQLWQTAGVKNYISLPMDAIAPVDSVEEATINKVLKILQDPGTPRPIYIHCTHGVDRTGLMVALYRVEHDNWSAKKAHDEMVCRGHDPDPNGSNHFMDDYFFARVTGVAPAIVSPVTFLPNQITAVPEKIGASRLLHGGLVSSAEMAADLVINYGVKTVINLEGGAWDNPNFVQMFSADTWHQELEIVDPGSSPDAIALEKQNFAELGLRNYQNLPIGGSPASTKAAIEQALKILSDPTTPSPIYIHSSADRLWTDFIISLYRLKVDGWPPEAAHAELMAAGFDVHQFSSLETYFAVQAGESYKPAADPYARESYCNRLNND